MDSTVEPICGLLITSESDQQNSSCAEVLWFEIFKRCDNTALLRAELTCQLFHRILRKPKFWIEKCKYDGVAMPSVSWRKYVHEEAHDAPYNAGMPAKYAFDYKRICIDQPFDRNLAITLNSSRNLDDLLKKGIVITYGGVRITEQSPFWVPSMLGSDACYWCRRYFEIKLNKAGLEDWVMDLVRPEITIRERDTCRRAYGRSYMIEAQLLRIDEVFDAHGSDSDAVGASKKKGNHTTRFFCAKQKCSELWEGGKSWELIEYVFKDYPAGMRKLGVLSQGENTPWGWNGDDADSKFGALEVYIKLPNTPRILDPQEDSQLQ